MNDNEWCKEWQRVVQRVTTNDSEWQRVTTSRTTNDNEWQRVTASDHFDSSFFFSNKRGAYHWASQGELFKHWRGPLKKAHWIKSRYEPLRRILTVKKRNGRSSCSLIFIKISVLKNFAIFTRKQLCWSLFLRKWQVLKHASLLKGDSNTGVFLWILQNF